MKSMKLIMESFQKNLKEMEQEEEIEEIPEEVKEMLATGDIEDFKHGLFFLESLGINFDKNELISFLVEKGVLPKVSGGYILWTGNHWINKEKMKSHVNFFWELLNQDFDLHNTQYYSSIKGYRFNSLYDEEYIDQVGKLTGLEELEMDSNSLTEFPEGIRNLKNLKTLDISDNYLTKVPEWIGELTNLKSLILRYNKLTTLPDSIANLENNLYDLRMEGNNFSSEEMERINQVLLPDTYITF